MDPQRLLTRTSRHKPWGPGVARILAAGLQAVDPADAVQRFCRREGDTFTVAGRAYPVGPERRVFLVGAGKAGLPMARAASELLGDRLVGGLVIVKEGYGGLDGRVGPVRIVEAGHPLPDRRGLEASAAMANLLAETKPADLVLCLISGGGSALLTRPAPGVTLGDLRELTDQLLASGAAIQEINTLRKHLDQVKGGGLARLAAPAEVITLILSDVVGNPLDIIASGPTIPDPGTFGQALEVLDRYGLQDRAPAPVRRHLEAGLAARIPETPKPGDPLFERVWNVLVGSNEQAARAAETQAQAEGYHTLLLTTYLQGEARETGRALAAIARQMAADGRPLPRPACLVAGGETTVTLRGRGLGGRNQELALGAVEDLAGVPGVALVTLATDGGDGPTDAAGALVTGETSARARSAGLQTAASLAENDSYHYFERLGDLLRPGPTQTNVNDLVFVFAFAADHFSPSSLEETVR